MSNEIAACMCAYINETSRSKKNNNGKPTQKDAAKYFNRTIANSVWSWSEWVYVSLCFSSFHYNAIQISQWVNRICRNFVCFQIIWNGQTVDADSDLSVFICQNINFNIDWIKLKRRELWVFLFTHQYATQLVPFQ